MAGTFRIEGYGTIKQKQDGTWWDPDDNKMSNEKLFRIFGNKNLSQNSKTGQLNFNWDYYQNRTPAQKDQEQKQDFNFPEGGAYDIKGNPRVRDYKKRPLNKYEQLENELSNMGGNMGGRRREDMFDALDSMGGKGFWEPTPADQLPTPGNRPTWEDVQNSKQMYRGDMPKESYASPFGQGIPYSSSLGNRGPSRSSYLEETDVGPYGNGASPNNRLRELSPQEINQFNNQSWNTMKNWRQ